MNIDHTKKIISTHGIYASVHDLCYRGANRIADTTLLVGMRITMATLDRTFLAGNGEGWGFVERDELLAQVEAHGATKLDMDEALVRSATARGDRCFGLIVDGTLVSYGWYSSMPTEAFDGLVLHFHRDYAYMYKGFTLPEFRGQRLHGIGMARSLAAHTADGKLGLVSFVQSNNFASLKSCYRLGYVDFGRLFAAKVNGRHLTHASRGCKPYDFRLEPVRS